MICVYKSYRNGADYKKGREIWISNVCVNLIVFNE